MKKDFPILEFDESRDVIIDPRKVIAPVAGISSYCVICFFEEAISRLIESHPHNVVGYFKSEGLEKKVYNVDFDGTDICLISALPGASIAAAFIDEISAMGCKKFLAIGGAGVLDKNIQVGKLMVPTSALRQEGTSYHYMAPSREVELEKRTVDIIQKYLAENKIPFIAGKTWTTDSFYRETRGLYELRKSEGCIAVEMECAAFAAASKYYGVDFGQILYGGDTLDGDEWDRRQWHDRAEIRFNLLNHAMKLVQRF